MLPHFEDVTTFDFKITFPLGIYGLLLTDLVKELPGQVYNSANKVGLILALMELSL